MSQNLSNSQNSSVSYHEEDISVHADGTSGSDEERDEFASSGTQRQVVGAAVVGGLAGLLVAGPILGLVAAGGAAAIATTRGQAGNVARSTGDVMSDAGTRLKRFDEKHRVVEKTSKGVVKGCAWVSKKLNQQPMNKTQAQRPSPSVPVV